MTYEGSRFAEEHGFDEERCVVSHDRSGALGGYKARLAETREDHPGQTRACALSRPMSALSHERT